MNSCQFQVFEDYRVIRSEPSRANGKRKAPATHSRGKGGGKKKVVKLIKKKKEKKISESTVESKTLASDVFFFPFLLKQQLDLTLGIKIGNDLSKTKQNKVTVEQNYSR